MKDWVTTELPKTDRPKTLVIWGPSRTGKTSWARSLGNHTYLKYTWSVKQLRMGCQYVIMDDIDIANSFKLWQPFLGECYHCKKETILTFSFRCLKRVFCDRQVHKEEYCPELRQALHLIEQPEPLRHPWIERVEEGIFIGQMCVCQPWA